MMIVSPLRIGLWFPFQMAYLNGLQMGVILITYNSEKMILQEPSSKAGEKKTGLANAKNIFIGSNTSTFREKGRKKNTNLNQ